MVDSLYVARFKWVGESDLIRRDCDQGAKPVGIVLTICVGESDLIRRDCDTVVLEGVGDLFFVSEKVT